MTGTRLPVPQSVDLVAADEVQALIEATDRGSPRSRTRSRTTAAADQAEAEARGAGYRSRGVDVDDGPPPGVSRGTAHRGRARGTRAARRGGSRRTCGKPADRRRESRDERVRRLLVAQPGTNGGGHASARIVEWFRARRVAAAGRRATARRSATARRRARPWCAARRRSSRRSSWNPRPCRLPRRRSSRRRRCPLLRLPWSRRLCRSCRSCRSAGRRGHGHGRTRRDRSARGRAGIATRRPSRAGSARSRVSQPASTNSRVGDSRSRCGVADPGLHPAPAQLKRGSCPMPVRARFLLGMLSVVFVLVAIASPLVARRPTVRSTHSPGTPVRSRSGCRTWWRGSRWCVARNSR